MVRTCIKRGFIFALLSAFASAPGFAQTTLVPPPPLAQQLNKLQPVSRFASLPVAIRTGRFSVDGTSALGWKMAEPGAPFNVTDAAIPGLPGRRLIFAACSSDLCVIHYERGGVAHFYEILVLSLRASGWSAIWNLVGSKAIPNLEAFRAMVNRSALGRTWRIQPVKGDF
jgi:hypothetical protein